MNNQNPTSNTENTIEYTGKVWADGDGEVLYEYTKEQDGKQVRGIHNTSEYHATSANNR